MTQDRKKPPTTQQADEGRRRNPSSRDIAREADVSQSTVSRVLNNSPRISKATTMRVRSAAERLAYSPNAAARTLITGRSNLIGLVVSNITNPFYPEVIEAVASTAAKEHYNVVLCNTQEDRELHASYLELLIQHQVDGAILTSSLIDSQQLLDKVRIDRIPLVLLNRTVPNLAADAVHLDNERAGRLVAEHFVALGHQSVAFVGGLATTSTNAERLKGFRSGLADLGITPSPDCFTHGQFTRESGYALAQQLIAKSPRPTAFFCADDQIAFGAMDAILSAGLRIPEDIAVVGVDDVPTASLRQISLTTVRQPAAEMGRRAVKLLLERIRNGPGEEHIEIVIQPRLLVRRTCGGRVAPRVRTDGRMPAG
ncbi:MAG TPA: LacI family DNA-binding transcriptional regulator [Streptosporangiaceae bacterium]|nr:LacI family DNA-binding transcriptional regulator [Streptosporangiaceae bacterium]